MTFEEIPIRMLQLGVDRPWLCQECDYTPGTLAAILAPNGTNKTNKALRRIWEALDREEARQKTPALPAPLGDRVYLEPTTEQFDTWMRAVYSVPGRTFDSWSRQGLDEMAAEELGKLSRPAPRLHPVPENVTSPEPSHSTPDNIVELPFLGAVAAGEPVSIPLDETVVVPREYPTKHFVVRVNGQSGEPLYLDGDLWVIDGRDCHTPKNGKPCIVSDGTGSYLKKWNKSRRVFESINPQFDDVIPGEEAKLQGYPVEKLPAP